MEYLSRKERVMNGCVFVLSVQRAKAETELELLNSRRAAEEERAKREKVCIPVC